MRQLIAIRKTFELILALGTLSLASFALYAAEEPKDIKPDDKASPVELAKREMYTDPVAGYSVLIPNGYRKLTDDESREVFNGMSEVLGKKDIGERSRKRPPAWFIGPVNLKQPNEHPPSFAIAFTENQEQIDPSQIPVYKEMLEEKHKREGDKVGDLVLNVVTVDGIISLQEEGDMISPVNNERNRIIRVAVPGKGKWFDLIFNYSTDQNDPVRVALKETLDSFKVMEHPPENIENRNKWLRVLYYTVGFGLAGIVLSFVLRKLSGGK